MKNPIIPRIDEIMSPQGSILNGTSNIVYAMFIISGIIVETKIDINKIIASVIMIPVVA